jgi:hypothetical protein
LRAAAHISHELANQATRGMDRVHGRAHGAERKLYDVDF